MKIEDCVKSITANEQTGELEIEFKDEQTQEEVECIRQWVLGLAEQVEEDEDYFEDEEF